MIGAAAPNLALRPAPAAAHAARAGEDVAAVSAKHRGIQGPLAVPQRVLMGPGPSNAHARVLAAQSLPLLGHMHPAFFKVRRLADGHAQRLCAAAGRAPSHSAVLRY